MLEFSREIFINDLCLGSRFLCAVGLVQELFFSVLICVFKRISMSVPS
jgi:hypothetical protein